MTTARAVLKHLRSNFVGYIALFIALGGTSYAALGPIGASQIRNHVIQPVKFDPHLIGGVVRVWAVVTAGGRLVSGSRGAQSGSNGPGAPGTYGVVWPIRRAKLQRCAASANVILAAGVDGFADAAPVGDGAYVHTFNQQGLPVARPFSVVIVC